MDYAMSDARQISYSRQAIDLCREDASGRVGVRGAIECPKCGGLLSYSIAQNGHAWGKCSTQDCMLWATGG